MSPQSPSKHSSPLHNLPPLPFPSSITQSYVQTSDLNYHVLSTGDTTRPLILLLHGFPELAFSWRKVMRGLSELDQGYWVVGFDQRGFGRTTGWDSSEYKDVNLRQFSMIRIVTDAIRLVHALGRTEVHCVVGHDFGAVAAAWCALTRPDFFKSVVLMSHPYKGGPTLPLHPQLTPPPPDSVHKDLANLPSPRKAYKWYYSSPHAASDMNLPPSKLIPFLRSYFHLKSANWDGNDPHPLQEWSAPELAKMPNYYVMPLDSTMPSACANDMNENEWDVVERKGKAWLSDGDLEFYAREYERVGFQGSLNWYRSFTDDTNKGEMEVWAGKLLAVPMVFLGGEKDWGVWQDPGAMEGMEKKCLPGMFKGCIIVPDAGHWLQQEQPEAVIEHIRSFLSNLTK